eukprot:1151045-Pelagomonas_calceolata.AAC.9
MPALLCILGHASTHYTGGDAAAKRWHCPLHGSHLQRSILAPTLELQLHTTVQGGEENRKSI